MKARDNTATPHLNDHDAFPGWVTWSRRQNHRPETIKHRLRVLPLVSRQLPNGLLDATPDDLVRWDVSMLSYAVNTRRSYLDAVQSFYRYALQADLIATDPSAHLVRPRLPRSLPRPLPATATMRAIDTLPPGRERLCLLLMIGSGLRSMEVANLRRPDLLARPDGPMLHVREGKGGHERVIPIPEWLAAEITAHAGKHIVIEAVAGGPLTSLGVQYVARKGLAQAGIASNPHRLRHTYLTELWEQTKDPRFVQDVAGHADLKTIAGYTQWSARGKRDAIEQLPRPASSSGLRVVS